ncbi:hypothetical protein MKX01_013993 [Papaver californicum]|nr:hypothetical protein MKX01_013993 [Papaver californicum]
MKIVAVELVLPQPNRHCDMFGSQTSSKGSEELKQAEELKKKARAERFVPFCLSFYYYSFVFYWEDIAVVANTLLFLSEYLYSLPNLLNLQKVYSYLFNFRFGISAQSASDEEIKKKAQLARFGQTPKIDPVEEDKKKARAARFSLSTGKAKTQEKMVIAAEATGGV